LVEHLIVVQDVAGSNPVSHPILKSLQLNELQGFFVYVFDGQKSVRMKL
jgi:hypothetical protein